ncbi:unnamed protein product [Vitrella brassicaformis CCMP3155]|uniref:Chlorophyll a-b binding protein, chloroplastic n=1 Tax=Vitrella brassicaformis (strain CCMP3155) TaxID=1169540 RepID=A0A0G4GPI8_VITBC|nr:unnamed protein product [Vitrella brassicaformis CCMP3155]|eukprot:CEM32274.1 unnamed protein product [Vitrella brassicaformis CCMP3155]
MRVESRDAADGQRRGRPLRQRAERQADSRRAVVARLTQRVESARSVAPKFVNASAARWIRHDKPPAVFDSLENPSPCRQRPNFAALPSDIGAAHRDGSGSNPSDIGADASASDPTLTELFQSPSACPEHAVSSLHPHDKAVDSSAMGQILLWVSFLEMVGLVALRQTVSGSGRKPGAFRFDPLGSCKNKDPDYVRDMEEKEFNHCRAAMLAISGVLTQDAVFKTGFPYIGSYT